MKCRLLFMLLCFCIMLMGCMSNIKNSEILYNYNIVSDGNISNNNKYICTVNSRYAALNNYDFNDIEKLQYYSGGSSNLFLPNIEISDKVKVKMFCEFLKNYSYIEKEKEKLYIPEQKEIPTLFGSITGFSSSCSIFLIGKHGTKKYQIFLSKYKAYRANPLKNPSPEYKIGTKAASGKTTNDFFKNDALTLLLNKYLKDVKNEYKLKPDTTNPKP